MNISKLAESYISERPSIKDCVKKRLINYSSLSRLLLRELSLGEEHFDALLIACRRYYDKLKEKESQEGQVISILRNSKLEIKNRIIAVVVEKNRLYSLLSGLEKKARRKSEPFYVIEGSTAATIVTSAEFLREIKDTFGSSILRLNRNLALATIISPKALEVTPGVLAAMAGRLAEKNINIVENMSCWTDTLFVIDEKDIASFFAALKL